MYGLDLFSGIGGITVALQDYVTPLAYCEIDPYAQSTLLQNMQKGNLPKAPIWDDIRTLSGKELPVEIIYGGFPCQDISIAGLQKGLEGERSGLFFEILRLIDETKAPFIFLENVPNIRTKGAERVCKELAERGYDCRWCVISAASVGALHKRERWFLLAYSKDSRTRENVKGIWKGASGDGSNVPYAQCKRLEGQCESDRIHPKYSYISDSCGWKAEPNVGRKIDGLSEWLDENMKWLFISHLCIPVNGKLEDDTNGKAKKTRAHEVLQSLRSGINKESLQKWAFGGFDEFFKKETLLTYLRKFEETIDEAWVFLEGEETSETILRSLHLYKEFACAPHRSGYNEQCEREYSNPLQTLSQFLVYNAKEAWNEYCRKDALFEKRWDDVGYWELFTPRVAHGIPHRMDRIKCLGNSVVPLQVRKAFEMLVSKF